MDFKRSKQKTDVEVKETMAEMKIVGMKEERERGGVETVTGSEWVLQF